MRRPRNSMLAGTSTDLTSVASRNTATASPNPTCWLIIVSPIAAVKGGAKMYQRGGVKVYHLGAIGQQNVIS